MWKVVWACTTESTGPIRVARKSQPLGFCRELVPSHFMDFLIFSCCIFSMVVTRRFVAGSGSGSGESDQDAPVALKIIV